MPLAATLGDVGTAVRAAAVVAVAYVTANVLLIMRRSGRLGIALREEAHLVVVAILNAAVLAAGIACAVTGTPTAYQWLLLCLLGRPMLAFVFVLGTLRQSAA